MRSFKQLREEEESSNQIKRIKIKFGSGGSANDAEWNLGKIETELVLAMGDHSKDCFTFRFVSDTFHYVWEQELTFV